MQNRFFGPKIGVSICLCTLAAFLIASGISSTPSYENQLSANIKKKDKKKDKDKKDKVKKDKEPKTEKPNASKGKKARPDLPELDALSKRVMAAGVIRQKDKDEFYKITISYLKKTAPNAPADLWKWMDNNKKLTLELLLNIYPVYKTYPVMTALETLWKKFPQRASKYPHITLAQAHMMASGFSGKRELDKMMKTFEHYKFTVDNYNTMIIDPKHYPLTFLADSAVHWTTLAERTVIHNSYIKHKDEKIGPRAYFKSVVMKDIQAQNLETKQWAPKSLLVRVKGACGPQAIRNVCLGRTEGIMCAHARSGDHVWVITMKPKTTNDGTIVMKNGQAVLATDVSYSYNRHQGAQAVQTRMPRGIQRYYPYTVPKTKELLHHLPEMVTEAYNQGYDNYIDGLMTVAMLDRFLMNVKDAPKTQRLLNHFVKHSVHTAGVWEVLAQKSLKGFIDVDTAEKIARSSVIDIQFNPDQNKKEAARQKKREEKKVASGKEVKKKKSPSTVTKKRFSMLYQAYAGYLISHAYENAIEAAIQSSNKKRAQELMTRYKKACKEAYDFYDDRGRLVGLYTLSYVKMLAHLGDRDAFKKEVVDYAKRAKDQKGGGSYGDVSACLKKMVEMYASPRLWSNNTKTLPNGQVLRTEYVSLLNLKGGKKNNGSKKTTDARLEILEAIAKNVDPKSKVIKIIVAMYAKDLTDEKKYQILENYCVRGIVHPLIPVSQMGPIYTQLIPKSDYYIDVLSKKENARKTMGFIQHLMNNETKIKGATPNKCVGTLLGTASALDIEEFLEISKGTITKYYETASVQKIAYVIVQSSLSKERKIQELQLLQKRLQHMNRGEMYRDLYENLGARALICELNYRLTLGESIESVAKRIEDYLMTTTLTVGVRTVIGKFCGKYNPLSEKDKEKEKKKEKKSQNKKPKKGKAGKAKQVKITDADRKVIIALMLKMKKNFMKTALFNSAHNGENITYKLKIARFNEIYLNATGEAFISPFVLETAITDGKITATLKTPDDDAKLTDYRKKTMADFGIYYTLNGTPPTTQSKRYSQPFAPPAGSRVVLVAINSKNARTNPLLHQLPMSHSGWVAKGTNQQSLTKLIDGKSSTTLELAQQKGSISLDFTIDLKKAKTIYGFELSNRPSIGLAMSQQPSDNQLTRFEKYVSLIGKGKNKNKKDKDKKDKDKKDKDKNKDKTKKDKEKKGKENKVKVKVKGKGKGKKNRGVRLPSVAGPYQFEISMDNKNWTKYTGTFTKYVSGSSFRVVLPKPVSARYVRFSSSWAQKGTIAEFNLYDQPISPSEVKLAGYLPGVEQIENFFNKSVASHKGMKFYGVNGLVSKTQIQITMGVSREFGNLPTKTIERITLNVYNEWAKHFKSEGRPYNDKLATFLIVDQDGNRIAIVEDGKVTRKIAGHGAL